MVLRKARKKTETGVVIVTGNCCIPGFTVFDEAARQAVAQSVAESGQEVPVHELAATAAMMGAVPREVVAQLTQEFNRTGQLPLPLVLVDGEVVTCGIPVDAGKITAALQKAAEETKET